MPRKSSRIQARSPSPVMLDTEPEDEPAVTPGSSQGQGSSASDGDSQERSNQEEYDEPDDPQQPAESDDGNDSSDEEPPDDGMLTVYRLQGEFFLTKAQGYQKEVCKHIRIAKEIFTRMGRTYYGCCFIDDPECKCGHWESAESVKARRKEGIGLVVTGTHRYPRGKGPQYDLGDLLQESPVKVARMDICKGKRSTQAAAQLSAELDRQMRATQKKREVEKTQTKTKGNAKPNAHGTSYRGRGGGAGAGSSRHTAPGGGAGASAPPGRHGQPKRPGNPATHSNRSSTTNAQPFLNPPPRRPAVPSKPTPAPKKPGTFGSGRNQNGGVKNDSCNGNGKRDRNHVDLSEDDLDPDAMFRPKKVQRSKHPADLLKEAIERLSRPGLLYQIKLDFAETLFKDDHIFPRHVRQEGQGFVDMAQTMADAATKMEQTAKLLSGRGKGKEREQPEDPNGDPDRDIEEVLKDAIGVLKRHDVTVDAKIAFALKVFGNEKIYDSTLRSVATPMLENAGRTIRVEEDNARERAEGDVNDYNE